MNLSAIRAQAAKFCGDPQFTRYSSSDYDTAINRAQEQFALETRSLFKDTSYTSAAADASYDLPSDFMFEESVHFNGLPLNPVTRRDMAILSPDNDWTLTEGTPTHYIIDPEEAQKRILLYPIPQAGDASKTISLRYFPLPTAVSSDSDVPLNSSALLAEFHIALAAYACWLLLMGETPTQDIQVKKAEMMRIFSDATEKARSLFKTTSSSIWRMRGTRPV